RGWRARKPHERCGAPRSRAGIHAISAYRHFGLWPWQDQPGPKRRRPAPRWRRHRATGTGETQWGSSGGSTRARLREAAGLRAAAFFAGARRTFAVALRRAGPARFVTVFFTARFAGAFFFIVFLATFFAGAFFIVFVFFATLAMLISPIS